MKPRKLLFVAAAAPGDLITCFPVLPHCLKSTIMNTTAWNKHSSPSQICHGQSCLILKMIPWIIHQSYVVFRKPPSLRSLNRHMTNFPEILKAFSNESSVVNGDSSSRELLLQLHNRLLNRLLHAGKGSQASFRSVYKKAHAKFHKTFTLIFPFFKHS